MAAPASGSGAFAGANCAGGTYQVRRALCALSAGALLAAAQPILTRADAGRQGRGLRPHGDAHGLHSLAAPAGLLAGA